MKEEYFRHSNESTFPEIRICLILEGNQGASINKTKWEMRRMEKLKSEE